jgi:hypothetical protein
MTTRVPWLIALALLLNPPIWGGDRQVAVESSPSLLLPPYVQPLNGHSVAVTWKTAEPSFGWVEYGETRALGNQQIAKRHGLRRANVRTHQVILKGLNPGTIYYYRVRFKTITHFEPYRVEFGTEQRTEIKTLRTLPGPNQSVTAVIYNDLHNRWGTLEALCGAVAEVEADFAVFNGDCLADPTTARDAYEPLAAFVQAAQADEKPAVFVRGNHETRGAFARRLPRYLAWPGNRPYFAFTAGPVRWVVLDCGEDKPDTHREYSGLVDFDAFRREEGVWLKAEVASSAFRDAAWRVLVHHIPLYSDRRTEQYHQGYRKEWGAILANAGVDLALNAHTHRPAFHAPGSIGNPYPIFVGGGPELDKATVMVVEADAKQLSLRLLDAQGVELFPEFVATRGTLK